MKNKATQIIEKKVHFVTVFLVVVLILCSAGKGLFLEKENTNQCCVTDVTCDIVQFLKRKTRHRNAVSDQYPIGIKLVFNDDTVIKKCLKDKKLLRSLLQRLIGTPRPFNTDIIVAPVEGGSLDSFFQRFHNGMSLEESMNFEWIRLCSFNTFRCSSDVSPISLSRCGFFYTGTGSEVRCYSCGVTYDQWQPNDNVLSIHRRISPHCRHLSRTDQRDVPIRHRSVNGLSQEEARNFTSANLATTVPPSQILSSSSPTPAPSNQHHSDRNHLATDAAGNAEITFVTPNRSFPDTENNFRPENSSQHNRSPTPTTTTRTSSGQSNVSVNQHPRRTLYATSVDSSGVSSAAINKLSPLGVNFDKPRYPQYAVLTVRISTFNGWPARQSPRKMAEAGFVYAGYADYSRCFFCGGGLRNWEENDDPWIEHARWFPRCAYVKQNKGDQFIHLVHERLQEMLNDPTAASAPMPSNQSQGLNTQETETIERVSSAANQRDHHDNSATIESMPSYQSVLELGYPPDTIKNIIHKLTIIGKTAITSSDILEAIFQIEEGDSKLEENNSQETLQIMEENRQLKKQRLCMICVEKDSCVAFLPCSHLVCCEDCSPAMRKCPKCQKIVQGCIKTWLV